MNNHKLYFICFLFSIGFCINSFTQEKTEVLILGTYHLDQIEKFEEESLKSTLAYLYDFQFDAIGIEGMPTELLNDIQSRNNKAYEGLINYYGKNRLAYQRKYQKKLGLSFVETNHKIDSILQQDSIIQEARVNLLKYFFASGDFASSTLQYQYILKRSDNDNILIDQSDLEVLRKLSRSNNEIYSLAIPIAMNAGLQWLNYIDNLQDESILFAHFPNFLEDYKAHQNLFNELSERAVFKKVDSLIQSGVANQNLFPLYEYLNSEKYQSADNEAQWKIWLNTNFESKTDLSRYALWEMRNLQIAANILKLSAFFPGKRILIIIGSSHKYFIEKHLSVCPNIKLLEF